ncbi:hypothetical protein [Streptomyces sp. NPDC005732]|uniref:hypothetical protein n=1 Tax=Streptomyces sp. NPDC005732 TaxID=3157057 RepID=UPI0033E77128
MNAINDERRGEAAQPAYDGATCGCGETWFALDGDNDAPNGAVCMTKEGVVTGYHGKPRCMSCGRPYQLERQRPGRVPTI